MPAGQQVPRSFSVTVPGNAEPGQYATSIVLENDVAIAGTGAVALDQIVRQALPAAVRVPGPLEPAFEFGEGLHKFSGERSLVGVEIANTGNASLKPAGDSTVRDESGEIVSEAAITMDTFFAGTDAHVETVLDGTLDPGDYTLTASMTDPESGVTATGDKLPFTVEPPENESTADAGPESLPEIVQNSGNGILIYLTGAAVVLLLIVLFLLIRNHRRQND